MKRVRVEKALWHSTALIKESQDLATESGQLLACSRRLRKKSKILIEKLQRHYPALAAARRRRQTRPILEAANQPGAPC